MFINMFKILMVMMILLNILYLNMTFLLNLQIMISLNETFMNFLSKFLLVFDMYSLSFFLIIAMVVMNVFSFMNMYMYMNKNMKIFLFMTKMFIFSMFLIVFTFNLWSMIFGWEGLGMSSFYLILYYNNYESWKSAIKTFINNKMGDCMILMSMILFCINNNFTKMMMFIFILSLMTKSAQYPFMAWLPMAMSAPTPISAMVHSSTLVTAGLFIMFRFMNFVVNKFNLNVFTNICLISMFISGLKAIQEKDMKKMIALSTLSQISLIFFFLLNNMKILAFVYMCNHALFKSMMFINMGMMMMSNFSNQLSFNMNNLNVSSMYLISYKISCFNLMNLSFFSSFFIKEKMLNDMESNLFNMMKFVIFLINSFLTMNYSLKMIFFFNSMNLSKKNNLLLMKKNYNIFFLLMNFLSIGLSKIIMKFYLSMEMVNLYMMIFYMISMLMNFKIYKKDIFMINSMMYLNFLFFIIPMMAMKNNMEKNEMWMEKFSLNFYFFLKNKKMAKSFNMNYNLIMMMFLMIMFL